MESVVWKESKERLPKIKSCPFCGGYSRLERKSKTVIKGEQKYVTYVRCCECDVRGPRLLLSDNCDVTRTREIAIKRWNRRVYEDNE